MPLRKEYIKEHNKFQKQKSKKSKTKSRLSTTNFKKSEKCILTYEKIRVPLPNLVLQKRALRIRIQIIYSNIPSEPIFSNHKTFKK